MESKGDQISILREIITSTAADVAIRVKSKVGSVKPPKSPKGPRLRSSTPHSYEAHQSQFLGLSRKHHQHDSTYESNYGVESKIDDLEEYAVRGRKPSTESRSRQESNRIGGGSASGRSMSPAKQAASLTLLRSSMKVQRVFGDVMK
ncbi:hypothetical protein BCR33DRAFT_357014 [Rhizoclosmatium globosum]|uniref:Uncharacterized protein n=1 Tax=Rhizoclosmatium globosum TaxID=329046 RepID=A0A1Y2C170_9FUNG|nr:hypothetical protein BCR33DRAFT_357014 [Rhizoclosmatium globosum]|eukprot:ORY40706.1 hypothetical protein BCR33DRAFT_357014 [Rhizoclosmatium globosum]